MTHFAEPTEPHDCRACEHFGGMLNHVNGLCTRPGAASVVGQPEHGCAWWVRATGADDAAERD